MCLLLTLLILGKCLGENGTERYVYFFLYLFSLGPLPLISVYLCVILMPSTIFFFNFHQYFQVFSLGGMVYYCNFVMDGSGIHPSQGFSDTKVRNMNGIDSENIVA